MSMNKAVRGVVQRLAMEPPFRMLARAALRLGRCSTSTRALWDLSRRPAYLTGMVAAAAQAMEQKVREISVIEFGVAGGQGLLAMQDEAAAVERDTGIGIKVYGFDRGAGGLPPLIGDHRDHPEEWKPGDYPMDAAALAPMLSSRTKLVLGNIEQTVPGFFENHRPPTIGFVVIDLDLYSSTCSALNLFTHPAKRMLWHTPMYFDDVGLMLNHRFAGELLAIDDFNATSAQVKIDRWRGIRRGRPFPERAYLEQMYVAHDIEATSSVRLERDEGRLPLTM